MRGVWQGQLAERYGLRGEVNEEQFARLSEGQHPMTGEALIRRQQAREYVNPWGETVRTALDEMEKYAQARIGGNASAQTTGAWAVAKFEHDSSRPIDGYAAPQLHTHAAIFNVTETAEGNTRSLQARELYRTQQFATAVYRSELAARLQKLGYEIERGAHGQPEIRGYTREYMEASSPRRQQIEERLAEQGWRGGSGADRRASHARCQAGPEYRRGAGAASKACRRTRKPAAESDGRGHATARRGA